MTEDFEYREPNGDRMRIVAHPGAIYLEPNGRDQRIPLDHVEHVISGIRRVAYHHMLNSAPGGPKCVCGDPIEVRTDPGEEGWIHSPGSDTGCLDARPAEEWGVDKIMRIVLEYVIESNGVGGIDCNDLVDRLEDAGYSLPHYEES